MAEIAPISLLSPIRALELSLVENDKGATTALEGLKMNHLYYGDNLAVLRESIADESVDLVYLDPPFNSNANYNIFFKGPSGKSSNAQIEAFDDTWHWGEEAERAYSEVLESPNTQAAELLQAVRSFLGESDLMAYLSIMTIRLIELYRVLKPNGSLYLHCDPTASHYLKIVLDVVFDPTMFLNEIIWRRTGSHNSARRYGPIHDTILFYAKGKSYTWNRTYAPYLKGYVEGYFNKRDERGIFRSQTLTGSDTRNGKSGEPWREHDVTSKGRHWAFPSALAEELGIENLSTHEKLEFLLQENYLASTVDGLPEYRQYLHLSKGTQRQDIWAYQPYTSGCLEGTNECIDADVKWLGKRGGDERLGYPTQKPVALLERILSASSNEGDVVLDPFCGCGTTVHAAQKLNRQWIGIDVTHLAISLIERRLKDAFPGIAFEVHGTPKDLESAHDLARRDKYQFQWWAVSMVGARPYGGKKKGADGGIDGILFFRGEKGTEKALVSVKGGENVGVGMVRDLIAVVEREKAALGVLISLALPTKPMEKEAIAAGFFDSPVGKVPRIQIITLAELFQGVRPRIPLIDASATFKTAAREKANNQESLF